MSETIELIGIALIPAFLAVDLFSPSRAYRRPRWWKVRALGVTLFNFFFSVGALLVLGTVVGANTLFDLSGLGMLGGAAVGVLVYETLTYAYHRAAHRFDWLWRSAHQMHHSAETIDAFGANYTHPIDVLAFTASSGLVFFPLLGVSPEAGALGGAFVTFNAMFQHMNKRTPHWVGYLIQRPESHCIHHQRGVHAYNYSDLPVIDMVFGTFRNPRSVEGAEAGFYDGASTRVVEMLVGRDVTTPRAEVETSPAAGPTSVWPRLSGTSR